ncbi:MAG: glycosyltransferase [Chitinophagales bacterium]
MTYDQRMQRISRSMTTFGYQVLLVGRTLNTSLPLQEEPFRQHRLNCWWQKGKLFYFEYNIRLFFFLLWQTFDGVCAIDLDTMPAAFFAARLKQKKIIYDAHEYFPEVPEVIERPAVQRFWRWIEKTFVPRCDAVYATTRGIADIFSKQYQINCAVVRNLPVLREQPNLPREPRTLLYQGTLNEGRGLEALITAMTQLDAQLWLAGEGDCSNALRQLAQQCGVTHKVHFLGRITPGALRDLTARATIGMNLLEHKGMSYYLSLANKFTDYAHAGLPQICISFPEYQRINQQWEIALLIHQTEPDTIVSAVNRLLNDEALYHHLQQQALACRTVLNWQEESKLLKPLYDQLF